MAKIQENIKHLTGRAEMFEPIHAKTTIDEILTRIYGVNWSDEIIMDWVYVEGYMAAYNTFEIKRFLEKNKNIPIEITQQYDDDVWFTISFTVDGRKVKFLVAGQIFEGIKHLPGVSDKELYQKFHDEPDPYKKREMAIHLDNIFLLKEYLKEEKKNSPHHYHISYPATFTSAGLWNALKCLKYLFENPEGYKYISQTDINYVAEKSIRYNYVSIFQYLVTRPEFAFLKDVEKLKEHVNSDELKDRYFLMNYHNLIKMSEKLKIKTNNMKKLNEQGGEQIYSEAHAKELLNAQVQYNKELQALNDRLAKKKSELAIKYMKLDQQSAAQKATAAKTQVPPVQKQTGTVDTTGQPVNAQGNPPSNESINILKIKSVNTEIMNEKEDDEPRYAKNLGYLRDQRNWYQKPENREGYVEPEEKRAPRKKVMTYKTKLMIDDLKYEIKDLEQEKENLQQRFFDPDIMSGEIEDFFGQIGMEAADILNSGGHLNTFEKIKALIKIGFDERKAKEIVEIYHEYYPEFDPKKEKEKKQAEKELTKIQGKIDKIQAKIDKWESMYESVNESAMVNESLSTYSIKGADKTELQSLKDYMNAEGIEYKESEDTIEFDDEQLDAEWRELISLMGLEPVEISASVDPEDDEEEIEKLTDVDDDIDLVDMEEDIDQDKVFYVKIDEDGNEFTGKIYKLFDEGDWRAKIVDGSSDTFEKLNYDPEFDVFDIIAFLRENYDDAEIIEQEEFEEKIEEGWGKNLAAGAMMGAASLMPMHAQTQKSDIDNKPKIERQLNRMQKEYEIAVQEYEQSKRKNPNYDADKKIYAELMQWKKKIENESKTYKFGDKIQPEKEMGENFHIETLDEFILNEATLKFSDGEEFETDGPMRLEERKDGWYVLGHGFLVPVKSEEEGQEIIDQMNKKYGE